MWKWKEGARGAVEKKNGVQDIPLLLLKETPEFKRFLCIVRNWPIILTDWPRCGLMTKTTLHGKTERDPQFCTWKAEWSLASSTSGRKYLTSELWNSPCAVQHHLQHIGGASSIIITLCPLLFFIFSAWNPRCTWICSTVTLPLSQNNVQSSPSCWDCILPFIDQEWI